MSRWGPTPPCHNPANFGISRRWTPTDRDCHRCCKEDQRDHPKSERGFAMLQAR
jgi:hypothetical protein